MKVLLVNPHIPAEATAGRYRRFLAPMPPISLAYVAAALEKAGVTVAVLDDATEKRGVESVLEATRAARPDAIGFSCVTITAMRTFALARAIREAFPGLHITMGNIHPSVFYESVLSDGLADTVVCGEGEETFPDLVKALETGRPLADVPGVAWRDGGRVVKNPDRPYIRDLDAVPFPAWKLFPLEKYSIFSFASVKSPGTLVLGSRGCPYRCTFCSLKIMGTARRVRSAKNIADEFEWLHDSFGYKQMSFTDPIFPFSKKEGMKFAAELISRGLDKKCVWITETRVDHVDYELLAALRSSGLRRVMYGFETGDTDRIAGIRKSFTTERARRAVEETRRAGVQIVGFFMLGVPGETKESLRRTIRFSREIGIEFAKFTVFSPFPGTQSYVDLAAEGKIEEPRAWERFTNYPSRRVRAAYVPDGLTSDDLMRAQRAAFLGFYLRPLTMLRHLFVIRSLSMKDILRGIATIFRR